MKQDHTDIYRTVTKYEKIEDLESGETLLITFDSKERIIESSLFDKDEKLIEESAYTYEADKVKIT